MSKHHPVPTNLRATRGQRFAIAAARFNGDIVNELLLRCVKRLKQLGVSERNINIHRVPGAFELPVAAKLLATTRKHSAIICLGAVIRGDTPHFDYVAGECARGIMQVGLDEALPVIFGVLTTNNLAQAKARLNVGAYSADAAIEMARLRRSK